MVQTTWSPRFLLNRKPMVQKQTESETGTESLGRKVSMGLTVRLQDERGKPVSEADIGIDFRIPTGDPSFRLLCYIDPYANTVFNQLQMETFLAEWEKVRRQAKTEDDT